MNAFSGVCLATVAAAVMIPFAFDSKKEIPAPTAVVAEAGPTSFTVDSGHSGVVFIVKHLDVSNFYGRFNKISGKFTIDDAKLEASTIDVTIDAESIDTNDDGRDKHLKGPDFFDVKQFPTLTLKSKSVAKGKAAGMYDVVADMTMHGVTKEVKFALAKTGEGETNPRFGYRIGFETMFAIKRSDFGMKTYIEQKVLGDDVRVFVSIEGMVAK